MLCTNETCHSEASVQLTQTVVRPTWFCPYCAAKVLVATNKRSFKTTSELRNCEYELKK